MRQEREAGAWATWMGQEPARIAGPGAGFARNLTRTPFQRGEGLAGPGSDLGRGR
jgi:hypothetical protein